MSLLPVLMSRFLSTPSARRATSFVQCCSETLIISIHALCEEGDSFLSPSAWTWRNFYPRPLRGGRPQSKKDIEAALEFLSTPSARRATRVDSAAGRRAPISIHALCEEGDEPKMSRWKQRLISIHALCEEGDGSPN